MKQPTFKYEGKEYRIISIVWDDNKVIAPTVIYKDDNGENQSINSKEGEILNV